MNIPVIFDEHIYEASAETLLDRIRSVQPGAHVLHALNICGARDTLTHRQTCGL